MITAICEATVGEAPVGSLYPSKRRPAKLEFYKPQQ